MGRGAIGYSDAKNLSVPRNEITEYKRNISHALFLAFGASKLTISELSKKTGISYPTIKKIFDYGINEIDDAIDPYYSFLFSHAVKIATALNVPVTIFDEPDTYNKDQPVINDELFLSKLKEEDALSVENDYYSRIISTYKYLTNEQKKVIIDLINCYFEKPETS